MLQTVPDPLNKSIVGSCVLSVTICSSTMNKNPCYSIIITFCNGKCQILVSVLYKPWVSLRNAIFIGKTKEGMHWRIRAVSKRELLLVLIFLCLLASTAELLPDIINERMMQEESRIYWWARETRHLTTKSTNIPMNTAVGKFKSSIINELLETC